MKIAIICDTAYQLLNAINITYHLKQQGTPCVDLFVGHQFFNSYVLSERVKEENLFENVYGFCPKGGAKSFSDFFKRFRQIIDTRLCLRELLVEAEDISQISYDKIYMSIASQFSVALIDQNPKADVYYFDDGTGSYQKDTGISMIHPLNRMVYHLLGKDLNRLNGKRLYLNNPAFASSEISIEIRPLPPLASAPKPLLEMLYRIWNIQDPDYYASHKLIYLTQPSDGRNLQDEELYQKTTALLKDICKDCLIRPHPRQLDIDTKGIALDEHRDLWELVCADQISDNHVLVALYSTAQLIPKLLYNKEPVLIFTYKTIQGVVSEQAEREMDAMVERLRSKYRNPHNIVQPKSIEELAQVLRGIDF